MPEDDRLKEADRLSDEHVKPLEAEHQGDYVAVSPKRETVFGESLLEVAEKAVATFGPGNFLFKVGERVVGAWR